MARESRAARIAELGLGARITELVLGAPVLGAAWVLALTARAFAGREDGRVFGVEATPIVELANRQFGEDVRGLTASLIAIAVVLGAAVGVAAELVLAARRAFRGGGLTLRSRALARVALVIGLHAALFSWGVARMPQLYADALYLREDALAAWARTFQVVVSDLLGPSGVIAIALFAVLAWAAPFPQDLLATVRRATPWLRRRALLVAPALALVLLAALFVRLGPGRPPKRRGGAPNVVILAVDSLRDDRLDPRTAPRLSAIASQGARFSRAYVTLPRTLPSWTTILTGREPHHHGLRTMFPRYEDRARDLDALPTRLAKLGYGSAVVGDYAADIFTRVRYGFDRVDAPTFNFHALIATRALERAVPLLPLLHGRVGRALMPAMRELNQAADPRLVAGDAIRMLDRLDDGKRPFLLTVFFSTAHFPYAAPAPWHGKFTDPAYRGRFRYHKPNVLGADGPPDDADVRQIRGLYDGAVAAVDDAAARILDALRARGLDDDTIVVVTADHGEMLYEAGHGQGHGDHLFGDPVVHVPLAVRLPPRLGALSGHVVPEVVRDVDLAPTLLELAGGTPPGFAPLDGRSLVPALFGKPFSKRPAFAETEVWMTESIPELPSGGPSPLRIPYPNVAGLTELDPRLGHDVVMRPEAEPIVIAAKHRMILDGDLKLVYVPTRKGARWFLYDRASDPEERVDLAASRPGDVARLRSELFRWMLEDRAMEERAGMLVPRTTPAPTAPGGFALRIP